MLGHGDLIHVEPYRFFEGFDGLLVLGMRLDAVFPGALVFLPVVLTAGLPDLAAGLLVVRPMPALLDALVLLSAFSLVAFANCDFGLLGVTAGSVTSNPLALTRLILQPMTFSISATLGSSAGLTNDIAVPLAPARPVRPTRCT
jgi:hypothetical protein